MVVTRHSSAGRDGCFNYPQRLMEPGRTLPALVSGTGQVSTRIYVEVLLMWKFMYCGFVVKRRSVILEVCWLKSHKQAFIKATWLKGRVSLRRQFKWTAPVHRLLRLDRHECELQLVVRGEEAQERPGTTSPEGRAVLADRTCLPALHSLPTNHDDAGRKRLSFCYWREGGYHRDAPPRGTLLTARGQRSDTAGIFSRPPPRSSSVLRPEARPHASFFYVNYSCVGRNTGVVEERRLRSSPFRHGSVVLR